MAANKEVMKAIDRLRLDRPGLAVQATILASPREDGLLAGLRVLAATFRDEAELWEQSGARGGKSSAATATLVAMEIDGIAAQLDSAGGGAALSVSSEEFPDNECTHGDGCPVHPDVHAVHRLDGETPPPPLPRNLSGLEQLIADSKAEQRGHLRDEQQPEPERKTAHAWNDDPRIDPVVVSWSDFGNSAHRLGVPMGPELLITQAEFEQVRDNGAVTVRSRTIERRPDGVLLVDGDDVTAYIAGDADDIPGTPPLAPNSIADQTAHLGTVAMQDNGDGTASNIEQISVTIPATATPYRVLVTGSRDWTDADKINDQLGIALMTHRGRMVLVHGDCPQGADALADTWAGVNGVPVERYPAKWDELGKKAGYVRNQMMVDTRPDIVLSFNKGGSRGTEHCTATAEAAGLKVLRFTDQAAADVTPTTWETETMTADGLRPPGVPTTDGPAAAAPMLGQPGDGGTGYSHAYVPAGGRKLSFADLLMPVPAASLPAHLSHSQIDDIGDCTAKWRMARVEQLPQVPQWANVGGSAFHAAVEAFERTVEKFNTSNTDWSGYDVEATWQHHFEGQISAVQATTPVPVSMWRASRKGAEGRAWWDVNGPAMLRRYLDARPTERTFEHADATTAIVPAYELELTADVPTPYGSLPFRAVIDRITISADGLTLTIRDYKSAYERPGDTMQLGEYAWTLVFAGLVPAGIKILGTYFDARRGTWTDPVNLLEAHPFEEFQYRITAAHAQKAALTVGPTPARKSSYCGGCAVRYACPIMAAKT